MAKTILIDLDGVLNQYDGNFDKNIIPEIKSGANDFLQKLSKNFDIKFFTTRNKLLTAKWLIKYNLDEFISDITNTKDLAYLYVDDRCVCFNGDFDKSVDEINNFKVYWK
ncbi:hypothetical protein KBA27_03305 [bacterium]|nr:hypothetical protein [bacterium]